MAEEPALRCSVPVEALARLPPEVCICENTEVVGAHWSEPDSDSVVAHWQLDLLDGECMQADIVRTAHQREHSAAPLWPWLVQRTAFDARERLGQRDRRGECAGVAGDRDDYRSFAGPTL